jgi:large subunit ribosomal protein L31e
MADEKDKINKEEKKGESEGKVVIEREYIVPLRKEWLKVPRYRRAKKAVKALKEFMARHMKIYDRDLRKIKLDTYLNNELWFRGIKKPAHKIKIKAIKYEN